MAAVTFADVDKRFGAVEAQQWLREERTETRAALEAWEAGKYPDDESGRKIAALAKRSDEKTADRIREYCQLLTWVLLQAEDTLHDQVEDTEKLHIEGKAAFARLAALKREGSGKSRAIEFGIGVHYGDVVFGNAGTPERLKFGVLGRAVNEVARTADMAKSLNRPVVVSDEVARRANIALADLGLHELRGIPQARRLWAMEVG